MYTYIVQYNIECMAYMQGLPARSWVVHTGLVVSSVHTVSVAPRLSEDCHAEHLSSIIKGDTRNTTSM